MIEMAKARLGLTIVVAAFGFSVVSAARAQDAANGQAVAFDRAKGNCLACHTMKGGDVASNVGPELNNMKARFPDPKELQAIIRNEQARNPQTIMPPFGKALILNDNEIGDILAFLYSL